MGDTLGDALPKELARVREVLAIYIGVGPPGAFASMMIKNSLKLADEAIISGDVVAMIAAYEDLKTIKE